MTDQETKSAEEFAAMAVMRGRGKCGSIGYPEYAGGGRWRTFCSRPLGHDGQHGVVQTMTTLTHPWTDSDR